ncbi:MAG: ATP-dependent metallopeptidase FtsH/Yme1/Tma family protein, partial [Eubacteriales bacterium]
MKVNVKNIIFFLLLILVFVIGAMLLSDIGKTEKVISYSELVEMFEEDRVTEFSVDKNAAITVVYHPKDAAGNV